MMSRQVKSHVYTVLMFALVLAAAAVFFGCATESRDDAEKDPVAVQEVPAESTAEPDEDFEVTEELYEQTFSEVEEVILTLNELIRSDDFEGWREYLTQEYIDEITSEENLAELNQSTLLQRNDIVIEDLEDYFEYVVAPSRSNLRLDDIEFIDDNTVQAIMIVRDRRAILYLLRRIDGEWRISI